MRLNMNTGAWEMGPAFTPTRADFGLASDGSKLYAIGGDTPGGSFFDSTNAVERARPELVAGWDMGGLAAEPAGSEPPGEPAGFFSTGRSEAKSGRQVESTEPRSSSCLTTLPVDDGRSTTAATTTSATATTSAAATSATTASATSASATTASATSATSATTTSATSATSAATTSATSATTTSATTTTAATTTSATASATSASAGPLPRAAGDRTEARSGEAKIRATALLGRPGPQRRAPGAARGRVIAQSPRPGAFKRRGFPVKLVVGRR